MAATVSAIYELLEMVKGAKDKAIEESVSGKKESGEPLLAYAEAVSVEAGLTHALKQCRHEIELDGATQDIVMRVAAHLQMGEELTVKCNKHESL